MATSLVEDVRAVGVVADPLSIEQAGPRIETRAVSGGLFTALAQTSQLVLTVLYTAVLARLLSPRDFGLVALGTAVAGLLQVFRDAGLSTATIQRENITHAQVSNLFWINLGVAGIASSAMAISAPLLAWFFREPPLVGVAVMLSVGFLFDGLAVQHMALLNRQMRFRTISVIDVGATAAGFAVGVGMALLDCGYWSLVGATLSTAAIRVTSIWAVSPWRPQRPVRRSGTRPLVRFGADLTLVGILFAITRGADSLLIGRFLGSDAVGLYSRATALLTRPLDRVVSPISSVIVPVLSRLQMQPDRYRRAFIPVFEGLTIVGFIFAGLFLPLAYPIVAVTLGQRWESAAPIFAALSISAIYLPLVTATSWLYTSQARGGDLLLTASIHAVVMLAAVVAGLPFGATGVAVGYSAAGLLIQLPVACFIAGRRGQVSAKDLWVAGIRHCPLFLVVLAGTSLAAWYTSPFTPLVQLLLCVPAGLLATAASVLLFSHTRQTATQVFNVLKGLRTPQMPAESV